MRRYSIWLIFLFILIGLTGFYLLEQRDVFQQLPFNSELPFENISNATTDEDGNLYVINKDKQQIIKLDTKGTVEFKYENIETKQPFQYLDMLVDKTGRLHVLKVNFFPYSDWIRSESILRYHPDGTFDKMLHFIEYPQENRADQTINDLQQNNERLHFLTLDEDSIYSNTLDLTSEELKTTFVSKFPESHHIHEIAAITPDAIVYSTKRGELYKLEQGKPELIYKNEGEGIGRGVVERLIGGMRNDLYYVDRHKNDVVRFLLDGAKETILLNREVIVAQGYSFALSNIENIAKSSDGTTIITQPNRVITLDQAGKIQTLHERGLYSQEHRLFQWWIWFLPILLIALTLFTLRFTYLYVLNRELSLIVKQILLFICLLSVSFGVFSYFIYQNFTNKLEQETEQKLMILANVIERTISDDSLERLKTTKDYMNDEYMTLNNKISGISEEQDTYIYKVQNGNLYTVLDERKAMFSPVDLTPEREAARNGQRNFKDVEYALIGPLYNQQGEVIGQYEVSADKHTLQKSKDEFLALIYKYIIFIGAVAFLLFTTLTAVMLYPIRTLSSTVSEIAKGKWETAISIHSSDEVAHLGEQVNRMSEQVRKHSEKMTELNQAYYRFVPQLFLQYLGKESVLDLQLGDQTEQEKTILIIKMRSFFSFSKNLTPEENFKFINSFLSRFSPIIKQNSGLVNKYIGAGALTFFQQDSKQAVESAIQMRDALITYNTHLGKIGYSPIDIGIGIHKGPIMLGVIGEKDRLEGAAISDDVNLTEMLEEISEILGVSILVTQSVIDDLKETKNYQYRNLGVVTVSKRDEPIQLYDIYQGDSDLVCKLKEETKAIFETGIIMYQDGRFFDARSNFIEVIKKNPADKTAKLYFYLCDEYYQKGTPKDWNGTLMIK